MGRSARKPGRRFSTNSRRRSPAASPRRRLLRHGDGTSGAVHPVCSSARVPVPGFDSHAHSSSSRSRLSGRREITVEQRPLEVSPPYLIDSSGARDDCRCEFPRGTRRQRNPRRRRPRPLELMSAPKASPPDSVRHFSCNEAISGSAAVGAMAPTMDPAAPSVASVREVGRGHAPLWRYFSRVWPRKRQTRPLLPPKGTDPGPLRLFPCKPAFSRGGARGHHRPLGPPGKSTPDGGRRPCPRCGSTSRGC
jgi:hypothetical protein